MSNLYSPDIVGPLHCWTGQIVDDSNWYPNQNPGIHDRNDVPGYGFRYKVRIFGRDVRGKDQVPDEQLDWATVVLPVTAGSGHGGSVQTPNLRQGAYVMGYYEDGARATKPVIMGAFPNHSQTILFGGDTTENFSPRSGYKGKSGDKPVSTKNLYAAGPSSLGACESAHNENCVNHQDQQKDGARCHYIPKTKKCDGPSGEIKGVQRFIKNTLALIQRVKAEANSFLGAASDITNTISGIVSDAANFISSLMKSLLDKMRGFIVNKLQAGIKALVDLLPPNQRPGFNQVNETATDTLQCVFNKIIRGLVGLITQLLNGLIDKYINAPMCAIENFIGSILSSILGDITSAISGVLSVIQGALGAIGNIANQIFGALDVLIGVLKFLSCDEETDCTMGEEWSFWGGAKCAVENVRAGIGSFYQGVLSGVASSDTPPCNTSAFPCGPPTFSITGNTAVPANAPGFIADAIGNPIVSVTGSILGIDLVSGGSYTNRPNVVVSDTCGIGGGVVAVPIMGSPGIGTTVTTTITTTSGTTRIVAGTTRVLEGTSVLVNNGETIIITVNGEQIPPIQGTVTIINNNVTTAGKTEVGDAITVITTGGITTSSIQQSSDTYPVEKIVIIDPGTGFLSAPNGDLGGNGDVWATKEQTVVQRNDGSYDVPYNPGSVIDVLPGDTVQYPGQPPVVITRPETITAPVYEATENPRGINPSTSNGQYPVVLSIESIFITNPGVSYFPTDKITITPDNGAVLEPKYDQQGRLVDVAVVSPGIGFTDIPKIYITSEQGVNAQMVPLFKITRIGDLPENQDIVPPGTAIINVVDCVGRFS